jgi:hypothetical protein
MNKTKTYANAPTKETAFYMRRIDQICQQTSKAQGIRATFFSDVWVRERVGIKRAITGGGVPPELVKDFQGLWNAFRFRAMTAEVARHPGNRHSLLDGFPPARASTTRPIDQNHRMHVRAQLLSVPLPA